MKWIRTNLSQQRVLSLMMVLVLLSFGTITTFADEIAPPVSAPTEVVSLIGSGNSAEPYQISTCEDLQKVNDHLDASYILTGNVYCGDSASMNNGAGFVALGQFTGNYFDGRNYEIQDLNFNVSESNAVGLFQSISNQSMLRNLKLLRSHITNEYPENRDSNVTGGIAGLNEGLIENVTTDVYINAPGMVGGIAGYNTGTITRSQTTGRISMFQNIQSLMGGITGYNKGTISFALSRNTIETDISTNSICAGISGVSEDGVLNQVYSDSFIGCQGLEIIQSGLIGQSLGNTTVTDSLSTSWYNQGGNEFDGGLIGSNLSNTDLTGSAFDSYNAGTYYCDDLGNANCYVENIDNSNIDRFRNTSQISPINHWDINNVWQLTENYPNLLTAALTSMPPTNLHVVPGNMNSFSLTWNAPNDGIALDGYIVQQSGDGGATWATVDQPGGTGSTINNLDSAATYLFRVAAYSNNYGEGYYSFWLTVGGAPTPITQVTTSRSEAKAFLVSWEDSSVEPALATGYNIQYRKVGGTTDWTSAQYLAFPATSVPIVNLEESSSYEVRVQSYNARGYTEFSEPVTATTTTPSVRNISTCSDLQNMSDDVYSTYNLTGDIDCTETANWDNGKGFMPVGTFDRPFVGTINGQGHKITNLKMVRNNAPGGLLAFANGATIKNLKLDGGLIDHSQTDGFDLSIFNGETLDQLPIAGSFVGVGAGVTLDNVETNIPVYTSRIFGLSGGLIGGVTSNYFIGSIYYSAPTTITNAKSNGYVEGYIAGGVYALAVPVFMINQDFSQDNVENSRVVLDNVQRTGDTKCTQICAGAMAASGMQVDVNNFTNSGSVITNLTDTGTVFDRESGDIAHLCSFQSAGGISAVQLMFPLSINNSTNTGKIQSTSYTQKSICQGYEGSAQGIGGLVGTSVAPIDGLFDILFEGYVGNSIGDHKLTITNSSSSGAVETNVPYNAGGIVGFAWGDSLFDNVSSTSNVTSTADVDPMFNFMQFTFNSTGGFVGKILGGVEVRIAGELPSIKIMNAKIKNSYATGTVYTNNIAGGFVGSVDAWTDITKSYATGNVTGVIAGGFMGAAAGGVEGALNILGRINIENTFATGNVFASDKDDRLTVAGGYLGLGVFVGELNIKNSYAAGAVRIKNNSPDNRSVFGGFAGGIVNASSAASALPPEISGMLAEVGLSIHNDLNIDNVFTTSSVPPSTDLSGVLPYFANKEDVSPGIMSGSMFGITLEVSNNDFKVVNPSNYLDNIYYDASVSSDLSCGFTAGNFVTEQGPSIPILQPYDDACSSAASANSFKNTTTQAPLNEWNFGSNVWQKHANGLPTFTADPIVPPVEPDNPTVNPPSYDPPAVSPPEIKTIKDTVYKTVYKYVKTGIDNPASAISNGNEEFIKVLDTPVIARALSAPVDTPKATKEAQHASGFLSGAFNLLMKYLKLILAAIAGGLIATYFARKKKSNEDKNDNYSEDDPAKQYFSHASAQNQAQIPTDPTVRTWDGPPRGSP